MAVGTYPTSNNLLAVARRLIDGYDNQASRAMFVIVGDSINEWSNSVSGGASYSMGMRNTWGCNWLGTAIHPDGGADDVLGRHFSIAGGTVQSYSQAVAWAAGATSKVANTSFVYPTTANGYVYMASAITTGTTGGTEPTWPTTIGNTVVDGGVTWKCWDVFKLKSAYVDGVSATPAVVNWYPDVSPTRVPTFTPIAVLRTPTRSAWTAGATVKLNAYVTPTYPNGHSYKCTTAGVSDGTTEPDWPITSGGTVTDGTVVWTETPFQAAFGTFANCTLATAALGRWNVTGDWTVNKLRMDAILYNCPTGLREGWTDSFAAASRDSSWTVVRGTFTQAGGQSYATANGTGTPKNVVMYNNRKFTDCEVSLTLSATYSSNHTPGVMARMSVSASGAVSGYQFLSLAGSGLTVRDIIDDVINDSYTVAAGTLNPGDVLKMRVVGNVVTIYVNGVQKGTFDTTTYDSGSGPVFSTTTEGMVGYTTNATGVDFAVQDWTVAPLSNDTTNSFYWKAQRAGSDSHYIQDQACYAAAGSEAWAALSAVCDAHASNKAGAVLTGGAACGSDFAIYFGGTHVYRPDDDGTLHGVELLPIIANGSSRAKDLVDIIAGMGTSDLASWFSAWKVDQGPVVMIQFGQNIESAASSDIEGVWKPQIVSIINSMRTALLTISGCKKPLFILVSTPEPRSASSSSFYLGLQQACMEISQAYSDVGFLNLNRLAAVSAVVTANGFTADAAHPSYPNSTSGDSKGVSGVDYYAGLMWQELLKVYYAGSGAVTTLRNRDGL